MKQNCLRRQIQSSGIRIFCYYTKSQCIMVTVLAGTPALLSRKVFGFSHRPHDATPISEGCVDTSPRFGDELASLFSPIPVESSCAVQLMIHRPRESV